MKPIGLETATFAVGPDGARRYVDGRREMNHRSTTTYLKQVLGWRVARRRKAKRSTAGGPCPRTSGLRPPPDLEGIERDPFAARAGFNVDQLVGPATRRIIVTHGLCVDDGRRVAAHSRGAVHQRRHLAAISTAVA